MAIKTMNKLEYKITIPAKPEKVWNTMLNSETYKVWISAGWPGSTFEGNWRKGERLKFTSPGEGGTLVLLDVCQPFKRIEAHHVAVLNSNGTEDRTSDVAKGWIGTREHYTFDQSDGNTTLTVEIYTNPQWEQMFNDGWPVALEKLKNICE
jgi:uncharacterized protein YndB with AHSA1/START domain